MLWTKVTYYPDGTPKVSLREKVTVDHKIEQLLVVEIELTQAELELYGVGMAKTLIKLGMQLGSGQARACMA